MRTSAIKKWDLEQQTLAIAVCDAQVREMPRQPPTGSLKRKIHLE
jgi:hypothetical protein